MDFLSNLKAGDGGGGGGNIQIDQRKANAMQLSYLQSLDASVESIVATATHVALYDFSPSTSQWSRKDVEGSLFLVSTRDGRFQFVILNKKGDSGDFWEEIGEGFVCQKEEPYVMYKKESGIVGIWFYEEADCGRFQELFEEIGSGKRRGGAGGLGGGGQALLGMLKGPGGGGVGVPQGMPPQGMPPQGMPPQGMPPQGMPPQGMPPQGMGVMPALQQGMGAAAHHQQGVDVGRVRMLLENLGRNEGFCRILGEEMRRVGL